MKKLEISLLTHHKASDIYNLVLDVERYPEFLPWCLATRIIEGNNVDNIIADMLVNFKGLTYELRSDILYNKEDYVEVVQQQGPFKYMYNRWQFTSLNENQAKIDFTIEFEFTSILMNKLSGLFLDRAVEKITNAFIKRADNLYRKN